MDRVKSLTILRLLFLAAAIAFGVAGGLRFNATPNRQTLDLLQYATTLTHRAADANRLEVVYLREGRDEEIFRPRDDRLNAELDWRDMQSSLRKALSRPHFESIVGYDFVTEPDALQASLENLHDDLSQSRPPYALFALCGMCMLAALFIRPSGREQA